MEDEFYIIVSTDGAPARVVSLPGEFMYVHKHIFALISLVVLLQMETNITEVMIL